MRSWFARHPVSFMALYTVFYLTAFHWLEVNITVPAIWVHCQLDDVIPFWVHADGGETQASTPGCYAAFFWVFFLVACRKMASIAIAKMTPMG